jgi:hypothetical protein
MNGNNRITNRQDSRMFGFNGITNRNRWREQRPNIPTDIMKVSL